jgi:hypothetical protein
MKKSLFILITALGFTQITQAQITCEQTSLIVNVGNPDFVKMYHPGQYLISPQEENVFTWTVTDDQGTIIAEETIIDSSDFEFSHAIPTTETINISVVQINEAAGFAACSIEDVLFWEETEVLPGSFIYSWNLLYGNIGILGSNDLIAPTVNLYPNPSNDLINISFGKDQLSKLELYDLTGKLIFNRNLNTNAYALDIANYPSGIYIVKLFNENNESVNKRVIKK